jgi:hypothetical protein
MANILMASQHMESIYRTSISTASILKQAYSNRHACQHQLLERCTGLLCKHGAAHFPTSLRSCRRACTEHCLRRYGPNSAPSNTSHSQLAPTAMHAVRMAVPSDNTVVEEAMHGVAMQSYRAVPSHLLCSL